MSVSARQLFLLLQLGWPSMRIPILVTMSWPERLPCSDQFSPRLDFVKMGDLTFKAPDDAKYPAMQLAYSAGRSGGTMTGVLSAANEQASLLCCLYQDLSPLLGSQPFSCAIMPCLLLYLGCIVACICLLELTLQNICTGSSLS